MGSFCLLKKICGILFPGREEHLREADLGQSKEKISTFPPSLFFMFYTVSILLF